MPKTSIKKELAKKIPHPKSRKALQLTKHAKRLNKMEKVKLVHHVKQNLAGEKLLWFKEHLEPDVTKYTPELTMKVIDLYLSRFKEELEQIKLKHSIGNRKNRQHASREDIIRLTILQEKEEYSTCGLEIPDLLNPKQLEMLRNWEGELRFLQNFKLARYTRKHLEHLKNSSTLTEVNTSVQVSTEIQVDSSLNMESVKDTDVTEEDPEEECQSSVTEENIVEKPDSTMDVDN